MSSPCRNRIRISLSVLLLAAFTLGLTGQVLARQQDGTIYVTSVDGIINPVTQRHITRSVEKGERDGASLVVILLDTPGGLLSSTRKVFESLLNAQVPTVVFVSPRGAQAASAGTFITAAAHIAVMAPGTSIGAATPVSSGGEDLPKTLADKATNAAAADMRALAAARGRNAEKLEETVRNAASFSANEAVELNVVNFIAEDLDDLLAKLNGREIALVNGSVILDTQNARVHRLNMSLIDRFLFILADPNISFILLSLGGVGIIAELFNPGLIVPGVLGVIFLVLAFLGLGNLPVNWAGVALVLLAGALFVAEFFVSGFGLLGVGSIVSFILGALLLFAHFGTPSPTLPSLGVSLWVVIPLTVALVLLGVWVLLTIAKSRKVEQSLTLSPMIGMEGIVTTDLAPRGTIRVQTEIWTAEAPHGAIVKAGEKVRVLKVEGATLTVAPFINPAKPESTKTQG